MTLALSPETTLASRQASANYRANLDALAEREQSYDAAVPEVEWVFGRDGALTARDDDQWVGGCSIPKRAAMAQLGKLDLHGSVGCFLDPPHASAIRVALDTIRQNQAIIALVPDGDQLRLMLCCEDFSIDLRAGRLWLASNAEELRSLLAREPGLSIPTQFIRVTSSPAELIERLIAEAQPVFSQITAQRNEQIRHNRERWNRACARPKKLCVVAPSSATQWDDWGRTLANALNDRDCVRIDPDRPLQSSPLAVSQLTLECDAIVTVNRSRADAPNLIPDQMPWVTWATNGRVPDRNLCGVRDRLLLLDERDRELAKRVGWKDHEIADAKPPALAAPRELGKFISIVAESRSLVAPGNIDDFSSHRLLWEHIVHELTADPFALGDDALKYLDERMRELQVDPRTINREKLVDILLVPAYQQGLARTLIAAGIPLGTTLDAAALLHVWPDQNRLHALDFSGVPVIRPARSRNELINAARRALAGELPVATPAGPVISASLVRDLLARD